jgi:hypothetical protein
MYCGPYYAGVYTLFLTRFRTYKIASPPLTKMTSKDDIKGLVSLKFLRPWIGALSFAQDYSKYFFKCGLHSPSSAAAGKTGSNHGKGNMLFAILKSYHMLVG